MRADLCPVCRGQGKLPQMNDYSTSAIPLPVTCHGCSGAGWVCVPGEPMPIHPQVQPRIEIEWMSPTITPYPTETVTSGIVRGYPEGTTASWTVGASN